MTVRSKRNHHPGSQPKLVKRNKVEEAKPERVNIMRSLKQVEAPAPVAPVPTPPRQENIAKAALEELFALLEDYGPSWYTEEHHKRAMSALRAQ